MPVSVWADVGGTFTDCIVRDPAGRRETKVLSSGLIRAAVDSVADSGSAGTKLRMRSIPASEIAQFWRGATASLLRDDGSTTSLGTITDHHQNAISLSKPIPKNLINQTDTIEIDGGLEAPVLAALPSAQ